MLATAAAANIKKVQIKSTACLYIAKRNHTLCTLYINRRVNCVFYSIVSNVIQFDCELTYYIFLHICNFFSFLDLPRRRRSIQKTLWSSTRLAADLQPPASPHSPWSSRPISGWPEFHTRSDLLHNSECYTFITTKLNLPVQREYI